MSLNSKQIREIQSLYESVYAPKEESNNLVITEEEFYDLCEQILIDYFQSSGIELYEGRTKMNLLQRVNKHLIKPGIDKLLKPTTKTGGAVRIGGAAATGVGGGVEAVTGGENVRTVLAGIRNAPSLYDGLKQAVKNNMQGAGMILKDKKTGEYATTQQVKDKNKKESFELINLYIAEAESANQLADKLNQQEKDKKKKKEEEKKAAELEKKELSEPDFDDPSRNIGRGGNKDELDKLAAAEKKRKEDEAKKKEEERRAAELEKKELSEPDFDDPNRKINRGGPMPKPKEKEKDKEIKKDEKKNEIKKDKPKQYSTPVKDKTGLGSPIKPIKPGSARDVARARNEIKFGADHVGKLVNKTADYKAYKRGDITKQQFADKYPNSQTAKDLKKSKLPPSVMDFESYQPYDLVLDYIITEGHADTVEEAHYVMTQMDAETIQTIIAEYEIV